MIDEILLDFDNAKSGQLYLYAGSYTPHTGWEECETGRTNPFRRWRAFFSFDTSSIPAHYQIEWVWFRVMRRAGLPGNPETYVLRFSIGTFIGAALDGNAAEWNGGTLMLTLNSPPATKTTLDLADDGEDPCPYVNKSGDTDLKIWDDSYQGSGDAAWETNFNTDTSTRCRLYVGYSIPSATLTGIGTLSCAASVTYYGTATLTGIGTLSCTAMVISLASATLTGIGTLSCAAEVRSLLQMARHSASVSVSSSHSSSVTLSGSRSHSSSLTVSGSSSHSRSVTVSGVHTASLVCDPDDVAERGARRLPE